MTNGPWLGLYRSDRGQASLLELNGLLFRLFCLSVKCNLILFELHASPVGDSLQIFVLEWLCRRFFFRIKFLLASVEFDHVRTPDQK